MPPPDSPETNSEIRPYDTGTDPLDGPSADPNQPPPSNAKRIFAALIAAYTLAALLYHYLHHDQLGQTGAMFIGIPALLAIILALAPRARTVTGGILRGIAIFLLILAPLLGEGFLCILFASPLFFAVGLLVGAFVDWRRRREASSSVRLSCAAALLLPMALEGVVPGFTHTRSQTATVTRIVNASAPAVEAALSNSIDVTTPLPRFLRIGFPRPQWATGSGLAPGSTRTVHFNGAEGDPPGDLITSVEELRPGYVRYTATGDSSKLTQWIAWRSADVTWSPVDATHTRVTCTIHFDRSLDPWWYFGPWEQLAVHTAAGYLIDAGATPHHPQEQ